MTPHWLPRELVLNSNNVDDDYSCLFDVFKKDFIDAPLVTVDGLEVKTSTGLDPDSGSGYPYGFTHIVTTKNGGVRSIDYRRASKLPWVRPILENYQEDEVVSFWVDHPKGLRLYLWLKDFDFAVILTEMKSRRESVGSRRGVIITAFAVYPNMRRKMQMRYDRAIKILQ